MNPTKRTISLRSTRQSSPFAPALFSEGEGGRRPDEGALERSTSAHLQNDLDIDCSCSSHSNPPLYAFGTFSPRKKRGGRRRSIGGFGQKLTEELECVTEPLS